MRIRINHKVGVLSALLCLALYLIAPNSFAQQTSPPTPDNQVEQPADPSILLSAAQRVILLIDQGLASELWPHVSIVVKQSVEEQDFTQGIYASRRPLGAALNRHWSTISLVPHPGSEGTPAGLYMTLSFITNFAGKSGVKENITFREDDDGVWRMAGYALR